MSKEIGSTQDSGIDSDRITFPVTKLERSQLEPGVILVGMRSEENVEVMLGVIKSAMVLEQSPLLGEISDKTKLNSPSMSHDMFQALNQVSRQAEKLKIEGATITVLEPDRMMIGTRGERPTFDLKDYLCMEVGVDHVIEYKNGRQIRVRRHYEIGMFISTAINKAKGRTTASIFIKGRHLDSDKAAREAIKAARPKASVLSQAELEEKRWKKDKEREEGLARKRSRKISRDIQFPDDWHRKEQSLDFRNKRRIKRPMQGGRFSGVNPSKKRGRN